MEIEERIDQITKQVRILERVPREKRIEMYNRGAKNIYVIGSILLLVTLWIVIFGETIIDMGSLWDYSRGLTKNMWNIVAKLFFPVFLPAIFILGIPLEIRNYNVSSI